MNNKIYPPVYYTKYYFLKRHISGSGHFLVDVLDELTEQVYAGIYNDGDFYYLEDIINSEKEKIMNNLSNYSLEHLEIDELQILKRILLKKVIFGVDLENFTVELTRLSLWLKTFIFGTPLSFIEHHIKQGNSLIGSTIEEGNTIFIKTYDTHFFAYNFKDLFNDLADVQKKLSNLPDSTSDEINESKEIFKSQIKPKQDKLSLVLDFITLKKLYDTSLKQKIWKR